MEVFILLLVIVILFVVLALKGSVSGNFSTLEKKVDDLSRKISDLERQRQRQEAVEGRKVTEQMAAQRIQPEVTAKPEVRKPEPPVVINEALSEVRQERSAPPPPSRPAPPPPPPPVERVPTPGFFERNPDLEKFIGENLANKIGIAILVLGIGFFVKYAIDQQWINEIGRVFIGILCGGILLGIAHRLRKSFAPFSSVLVGGGIAVLYFTITIAFHEYQIFSQTVAFILMVVITAFTVLLAIGYNRIELAILAILGGFGAPFMVSTGEGNYIVLFTYILTLNSGMLVLAYFKKWRPVNVICYAFTILLFGGWLSSRFDVQNLAMVKGALVFATLFYLVFFTMNIINNIRERVTFQALEILMLLSNTFLYFSAGMIILNGPPQNDFRGLFTVTLALFNFVFAYALYRNMRADRNLVFMLIGLVLTFISLAAPIQLEGNYITLFWATEAVLLLWLSQKSGIKLIKYASVIVTALMGISLVIDWKQIYADMPSDVHLAIMLNKGYITSIIALVSLTLTYVLTRTEKDEQYFVVRVYRTGVIIAGCLFLYIAHLLELRHHLLYYVDDYATRTIIVGCYNMFFIMVVLLTERSKEVPAVVRTYFPLLGLLAMGSYILYYHGFVIDSRYLYLEGGSSAGFLFHYLLMLLVVVNVVISLKQINDLPELTASISNAHYWIYIVFFIFVASAELDHTVVLTAFSGMETVDHILSQNHKIGFPILWGITSFILIAVGFRKRIRTLRIISLALFLVTLLKLFIIDLRGISEGGKIAAFISLGILLLVVSFMYQRLKKLLLEDTSEEEKSEVV